MPPNDPFYLSPGAMIPPVVFRRIVMAISGLAALPVLAALPRTTETSAVSDLHPDSSAVVATVERFHSALAAGDTTAVLALLASDVVILESGDVETRQEYRAHHLLADVEFARTVASVRSPLQATVQGDAAWVTGTSTTKGTFKGRTIDSSGAELMVLSRAKTEWKIRAIHWSSRTRRPAS
jgi:ketosteroid isomerase-like protein